MRYLLSGLLILASGLQAQTLPAAVPTPLPEVQFFGPNGLPLAGGLLHTYAAGSTTPLDTYTDSSAMTANLNPIQLDPAGRASIWIGANAYKFVLTDALGVLQWTQDNVVDTTLNFVTFVKNAGTCTLITYSPPNGQPQVTCSAELTALTKSPYINLKLNCGAKGDGMTDDTAVINSCLGSNQVVFAPQGTYCVSNTITLPNKTQLLGSGRGDAGGPNTVFKACAGFPNATPVVTLCSTPGPCFGVQAENFTIDCNSKTGCIGAQNLYSQEQSWFRRILVANAQDKSFQIGSIAIPFAAQNSGPYEDLEGLPGSAATTGSVCVHLAYVPAFRGLRGITCNADGYSLLPDTAILLEGMAPAHVSDVHVEHYSTGIGLGSSAQTVSDIFVENVETGPENPTSVRIAIAGTAGKQNITILNVENSTAASNVIVDGCNGISLLAATAGSGFYATGYGTCGNQTIYTTRKDTTVNLQTSLNVLKNLTVPGTGTTSDDGKITIGPGLPYAIYAHESATSGEPGMVAKSDNNGLLIQNAQVTRGVLGGGLLLNGNGPSTSATIGMVGAGYSGDTATLTARAATASSVLFSAGKTYFHADSGLTPGSGFTPTQRMVVDTDGVQLIGRTTTPTCAAGGNTGRLWVNTATGPNQFKICGGNGSTTDYTTIWLGLHTPSSSAEACTPPSMWSDATYVYSCTAANTIKRIALVAF